MFEVEKLYDDSRLIAPDKWNESSTESQIETYGHDYAGYFYDYGKQEKWVTFLEYTADDYTNEFEVFFPDLQLQGNKNDLGWIETQIKMVLIQQHQC